jgi:outer membrane protein OmpA-like peptidoglycan-associated protein
MKNFCASSKRRTQAPKTLHKRLSYKRLSVSAPLRYVRMRKSARMVDARKYKGLGDMIRRRPIKEISNLNRASIAVAAAVTALLIAAPATAQQRFLGASNNVTIDLSVLGGGGSGRSLPLGPGETAVSSTHGGIVLFPPPRAPVSRLQGPLANQSFTLTAPAKPAPVLRAPVTTAPKAAETIPAPTPIAAAPTTPTVTAPPAPPSPAETPVQTATVSPPAPPAPVQTAATPPAGPLPQETRILFETGSPDLSDAAKSTLDALAASLNADDSLRIQLQAFASGTDETAPEARRLSLKRALNVRAHLVERNVRNTRMDVRALGIKSTGGPADRVDAVVVQK